MILVTVGTTMPFDELLEQVDRLAEAGSFTEPVLCQTGQSAYRMRHCAGFVSRPTLRDLIAESSFVICHGGATVIELLQARKPFATFPNPRGAGDHQSHFLSRIARTVPISWSRDVGDLERLYEERRRLGPVQSHAHAPHAADILLQDVRGVLDGQRRPPVARAARARTIARLRLPWPAQFALGRSRTG